MIDKKLLLRNRYSKVEKEEDKKEPENDVIEKEPASKQGNDTQ